MGYVGRGLNQDGGQYRKLDSIASSFDGSEVNFNLTIDGLEVTPICLIKFSNNCKFLKHDEKR